MVNQVTVGICAYNEANNIGGLLHNILREQDLSEDSEVIVVCSGCTDNTAEIVQDFALQDSRVKPYFEKERKGKASAINQILANARKEVIVFISADTLPTKGVFRKLTSKLNMPNVGIVSGNPIPINSSKSLIGRVVKLMWRFHGHVFEELNDAGLARHATEAFCIRNGIVNKIPPETINDDAYIAVTAKKKGWLIKYSAESTISMCGPRSYSEYFQQRRRVIYGHYQVRKLTGETPQYLVHMIPLHPLQVAKLTIWLLREYDLPTLGTFLLTEFLVNATAIMDVAVGKAHVLWTTLPSTKVVTSRL